jgi:hypothetical protein
LSYEQNSLLKKLQINIGETNIKNDYQAFSYEDLVAKSGWFYEGNCSTHKVYKPKKNFLLLIEMMFISDCISAINTLTYKKLGKLIRLS